MYNSADNGIIDAMQINPVKAFVIMNDYPIPIHQMNIKDVCKNEELLENGYLNANIRGKKIKELNFTKIRGQLESEILEKFNFWKYKMDSFIISELSFNMICLL